MPRCENTNEAKKSSYVQFHRSAKLEDLFVRDCLIWKRTVMTKFGNFLIDAPGFETQETKRIQKSSMLYIFRQCQACFLGINNKEYVSNFFYTSRHLSSSMNPENIMFKMKGPYEAIDSRVVPEKSLEVPRGVGLDVEDVSAGEFSANDDYTIKILSRQANSTQGNRILSLVPNHYLSQDHLDARIYLVGLDNLRKGRKIMF